MYKEYLQDIMGIKENKNSESTKGDVDNDVDAKSVEMRNKDQGQAVSSSSCLLEDDALIIVDNTLWKGLVLAEVSTVTFDAHIIIKRCAVIY